MVALETPMRVVAVVALNQSFVYPMVKRPREFRADIQVAAVAKLRRRFPEQKLRVSLRVMRRMTVNA